jgi:DNA-binding transcriptional LysR family regulator
MLVDRTQWILTPAGEAYHALISPAFDQLCSATQQVQRLPSVRLEIWSTPGIAYLWITGRLRDYHIRYPGSVVDLRPTDASPDLRRREAHADIRWIGAGAEPAIGALAGLRRIQIVRPRMFPVASPTAPWFARTEIAQPADLLGLPLLFEQDGNEWTAWFSGNGVSAQVPATSPRLWQAHMTLAAAREGQGAVLTNAFLAAEDLQAGRLVELGCGLQSFSPQQLGAYYLTAREDEWTMPSVARFRDWLMATIADCPADWVL